MTRRSTRIPSPPKPAMDRLAVDIPVPTMTVDNLSRPSSQLQDLNFKVDPELHRRFKMTAVVWGMSMKELLEASFKAWLEKHGERPANHQDR